MDNPVAMINVSGTAETWYYYYKDALGSVRLISNSGGSIVESYTYDPFGRPRRMSSSGSDGNWLTEDTAVYGYSSLGNSLMFTAQRWDSNTEQYYYRFRDYSPILGRFLQPDPAKYLDTMNLYQYCRNNSINWIDPWGLNSYLPPSVTPTGYDPDYGAGGPPPPAALRMGSAIIGSLVGLAIGEFNPALGVVAGAFIWQGGCELFTDPPATPISTPQSPPSPSVPDSTSPSEPNPTPPVSPEPNPSSDPVAGKKPPTSSN